jgi:serine/threonine-protein kinase
MTEARPLGDDQPTLARPLATGPEPRFAPGTLLAGRYRVIYPLGHGGMGEVYRADDLRLGQAVALKFVRSDLAAEARHRLYNEVRLGRQVSHPNVCRLYDIVEIDGLTFIAMEYVDGEDLASLLSRIGRLAADKALEIARDLCAGLQAAHDRGVLHRDLKPANVMIDGRGHARITDFGLAVEQQLALPRDRAGTALYMSPEQLAGAPISVRSDLYSLGLIFYEIIAGRRFFDASTADDLRRQHESDRRPRVGALSGQIDPAFERVIGQCLEEDAQARPASARAVLALLPGGDRLDAAIAAGETPAPDVVAAAGAVGDLRPAAAWGALLVLFGCLMLTVWTSDRLSMFPKTSPPKPPDVLLERARSVLKTLGRDVPPADWACAYEWDYSHLRHVSRNERSPDRFDRLRDAPLSPLYFFYRQSPERLVAANRNGRVDREDPPPNVPGMAEVVLDPQGRLRSYLAVPPRVEAGGPWPALDWAALFKEAELDPAAFRPVPPNWAAPVDSDHKSAWEGSYPGMPDTTVRLEAAAYHGRPVYFSLLPTWAAPEPIATLANDPGPAPIGSLLGAWFALALPLGGLLLARRNLRLGRGNPKGSLRVAIFVFVTYSVARLCNADHVADFGGEFGLMVKVFAYPMVWSALVWILYMALEPYARRRWPRILISWERLLAGAWRDPMVGRDVLVGAAAGTFSVGVAMLTVRVPSWLGQPQDWGWNLFHAESLTSWSSVAYRLLVNLYGAALWSIVWLFLLVLLRVLLRRNWLALGAWGVLLAVQHPFGSSPLLYLAVSLLFVAVDILVLVRFGLLGYSSSTLVGFLLTELPLTFDVSVWWAPRGFVALAAVVALGVYAFRTSLAGKPAFGGDWLEN